jgi:hypothetical protein
MGIASVTTMQSKPGTGLARVRVCPFFETRQRRRRRPVRILPDLR